MFVEKFGKGKLKPKATFMKTTRHTKIRLEKHEIKLVWFAQRESLYCRFCNAERQHLTVAETARSLNLSEREVFRLVESRQIHSIENDEGQLFICTYSAANFS